MLFHITTRDAWAAAGERYRASSLATEGFIHLSSDAQWPRTLERWFAGQTGLVLLTIDPAQLDAEVRWEDAHGEAFPHLYGSLPRTAVVSVATLVIGEGGRHRVDTGGAEMNR